MRFGLQKLTLLDFPGRVACTVFSAGCNFRCPFCHNASLVNVQTPLPYSADEIRSFLKKRQGVLDGVCFTGGEPLLGDGVIELVLAAKELGYQVKVDTNGSFPERLQKILDEKIADYVAMDIKSSPERYEVVCGNVNMLDAVRRSVELLKSSAVPFEFRTTVTGNLHRVEDFAAIGQWIAPVERYFLQGYVDSGDILQQSNAESFAVSNEMLQACLAEVQKFVPQAAIRGR